MDLINRLTEAKRLNRRLESVLDRAQQGVLAVDEDFVRTCFGCLDRLKDMIADLDGGLRAGPEAPAGAPAAGSGPPPLAEPAPEESMITREMELAFLKEAEEVAESVEQCFLRLGKDPGDTEALASVFRSVHSFKSNCGFFGYGDLERLSHGLESVLEEARSESRLPPAAGEIGLLCVDGLRAALGALARGCPPAVPGLERLLALLATGEAPAARAPAPAPPRAPPLGEILVAEGMLSPGEVEQALRIQAVAKGGEAPGDLAAQDGGGRRARRDLRVDLGKLDRLLDLAGELVISTGMVFSHPAVRDSGAADLEKSSHQLKGVVNDLQNAALGMRMIPLEGPFRKLTRLVHDLSAKSGKKVQLEFRGEDTEIDKHVADLIADPLVHLIRNAIDHGLESPAERVAAGKPESGTVTLEAGQEAGDILVAVRDDGRGMDRGKILRKAKERGLAPDDCSGLPDDDVFRFILLPGFSTADAVTSTSGRGVGLDVVKSNIDGLNGGISIRSRPGVGSAITLRIPLTLSIIEGMLVRIGESLFTIPLAAVRESFSPDPGRAFRPAGGQEAILVRGESLPIVRLGRLHRRYGPERDLADGVLICVEARDVSFCLFVDEILGQRQTVVKALPPYLGKVAGVSSCSILDDGGISLILDPAGIFAAHRRAGGGDDAAGDWSAAPARESQAGRSGAGGPRMAGSKA